MATTPEAPQPPSVGSPDEARLQLDRDRYGLERVKLEMDSKRLALEEFKIELEDKKLTLDRYRSRLERSKLKLEFYKVREDARKPSAEAITKFADATIRSLLILNGGAALALLTFAANARNLGSSIATDALQAAVLAFGSGAAAATATAFFTYVSQAIYHHRNDKAGNRVRAVAIVFGFVSLGAFAFGTWSASQIVKGAATPSVAVSAPRS